MPRRLSTTPLVLHHLAKKAATPMKQHTVQIDFDLNVDVSPAELELAILRAVQTREFGYHGLATVRHVSKIPLQGGPTGAVANPPLPTAQIAEGEGT